MDDGTYERLLSVFSLQAPNYIVLGNYSVASELPRPVTPFH